MLRLHFRSISEVFSSYCGESATAMVMGRQAWANLLRDCRLKEMRERGADEAFTASLRPDETVRRHLHSLISTYIHLDSLTSTYIHLHLLSSPYLQLP